MDINEKILRLKTDLLYNGLYLDTNLIDEYRKQGITLDFGRKGGAGPLGGRYFYLKDKKTLVNVALWNNPKKTCLKLGMNERGLFNVINSETEEILTKIKLVPNPRYYSDNNLTSDNIPMKQIALVHGYDCLATTVYQKCTHWACGEACKFCGIELSLQYNTTIVEKNADQINEVIRKAKEEQRCSHMTLTTGTDITSENTVNRYLNVLRGIKAKNPDLPLHIQIEPLDNKQLMVQLKDAGADTIGIHLEITDEKLRREITPGKAKIPYNQYEESWKNAIDTFGLNQVETFILVGFEQRVDDLIRKIENICELGVIPFITPVRAIPGSSQQFRKLSSENLLLVYKKAAEYMIKYHINPLKNKAGCVKCGGCSAISEAYKFKLDN